MKYRFGFLLLLMLLIVSSCAGQDASPKVTSRLKLEDSAKARLKEGLTIDREKPFVEEWKRKAALERKIVDDYGFEGIQLLFEERNSQNYFKLGSFPKDCPWISLNELSIQAAIEQDFEPIKDKVPHLVDALKERCEFIYAEKVNSGWYLHYFLGMKLYDGQPYYKVYSGGEPNANSQANASLQKFNWTIPNDLKDFYAVHDGFGDLSDIGYLMSSDEIVVKGEMMNPIAKQEGIVPEGYSFDDLLDFFPDGVGNAQCFLRSTTGTNTTVDWDHEIWEISRESSFFDFIDERLSEIDEE